MENEFVPYELARDLRELGFDGECIAFWNNYRELHLNSTYEFFDSHLKAPLYQQAVQFLAPKLLHNYRIIVVKESGAYWLQEYTQWDQEWDGVSNESNEDCIRQMIKIIKR